ncbi:hypothetical protein [Campylobacter helveticus]|uniref:RNA-binding protein (Jag domain) n=1 Tax=Campylobacter helveticus TaxID=28898 RepID=A0AAX2UH84_9BACT|nr:hypothetical protein [Campylobacter helveticus]ARE80625.1 hypothetical protein CHELV3228_1036 [Campylobacter helveticus]MCR2039399.1 hypothetical protein [Campylobacter helveticus]MCR2063106.1 hypothetical protein [Campylobacter helveticus]TNB55917.1 hypothetical protein FDW42_08360 [Campylobacter helveticus]TNB57472.1 hypothetical protein FDW44_06995 [Campylobacter helveticus]
MTNNATRLVINIKSQEVLDVLEQLPKGCKGLYIEQAILEFSRAKPRIEFHFDGITRPKRKRKTKEQIQNLKYENKGIKVIEKPLPQVEGDKGKMMFDFAKM